VECSFWVALSNLVLICCRTRSGLDWAAPLCFCSLALSCPSSSPSSTAEWTQRMSMTSKYPKYGKFVVAVHHPTDYSSLNKVLSFVYCFSLLTETQSAVVQSDERAGTKCCIINNISIKIFIHF